jgi:hypothetical protein
LFLAADLSCGMRQIAFVFCVSAELVFALNANAGGSPGSNGVFSHQRIIVNPRTGETMVPSGPNYIGTRSGTVYMPAGPNGIIDLRNGRFIPAQ